jgi:hypothetical protein
VGGSSEEDEVNDQF